MPSVSLCDGSDPEHRHCDPCEWRHPWVPVVQALNASTGPYAIYQYTKQDGQPLSPTLTIQAERLDAGASRESQSQTSYIYHCYEGRGYVELETPTGQKANFEWNSCDTFAVPAWTKVKCVNTSSSERAYLIAAHDGPLVDLALDGLKSIAMWSPMRTDSISCHITVLVFVFLCALRM